VLLTTHYGRRKQSPVWFPHHQKRIFTFWQDPSNLCECPPQKPIFLLKGGDPAAGSPTATLLRLHPSHQPHRGKRPPEG